MSWVGSHLLSSKLRSCYNRCGRRELVGTIYYLIQSTKNGLPGDPSYLYSLKNTSHVATTYRMSKSQTLSSMVSLTPQKMLMRVQYISVFWTKRNGAHIIGHSQDQGCSHKETDHPTPRAVWSETPLSTITTCTESIEHQHPEYVCVDRQYHRARLAMREPSAIQNLCRKPSHSHPTVNLGRSLESRQ